MVQNFIEQFTYLGLFLVLFAGGLGLPIPEEPVIVTGGVLAHEGIIRWELALPVCLVGVLLGDIIVYWVGHHWGERVLGWRGVRRVLSPERAETLRSGYRRHGIKILFAARHMMGLRVPAFLMAGTVRIPFWRFIAVDAGSALVSVTVAFGVAYVLTDRVTEILAGAQRFEQWLLIIALVTGLGVFMFLLYRRSRAVVVGSKEPTSCAGDSKAPRRPRADRLTVPTDRPRMEL